MPVDLNDIEVVSSPGTQTGGVGPDDYEVVSTPTPPSFTTDQGILGEAIVNPPPAAPSISPTQDEGLWSTAKSLVPEGIAGIGEAAAGAVSDLGAYASRFQRPQNVPQTLLPSLSNIQKAYAENKPYSDSEFSQADFEPKVDASKIQPSPVFQPSQFSSGQSALVPPSVNPDWAFTQAVSAPGTGIPSQIKQAVASIPGSQKVGEAFKYAGNVARAIPADIAETVHGTEPYYELHNLAAAALGDPMAIDEALREASSESPKAATIGKISQGIAGTAPMLAIGGLPAAAQKLALAGFTAKMISAAPQIATQLGDELGKPKDQQDQDKITSLVSEAIQTVGFSALGGLATMRGFRPEISEPFGPVRMAPEAGVPRGAVTAPMSRESPAPTTMEFAPPVPRRAPVAPPAMLSPGGLPPPADRPKIEAPPEVYMGSQLGRPEGALPPGSTGAVPGRVEIPARSKLTAEPAPVTAAKELNMTFDGVTRGPKVSQWGFTIKDKGPAYDATFNVPEGATREQIEAKRAAVKASFEAEDSDEKSPDESWEDYNARRKEKLFQERAVARKIPDEHIRITVTRNPGNAAADWVQVDEKTPGSTLADNPLSTNAERLRKAGYDIPTTEELKTLPHGQYTLAEARRLLSKNAGVGEELNQLQRLKEKGTLTPEQQKRYDELQKQHQTTVNKDAWKAKMQAELQKGKPASLTDEQMRAQSEIAQLQIQRADAMAEAIKAGKDASEVGKPFNDKIAELEKQLPPPPADAGPAPAPPPEAQRTDVDQLMQNSGRTREEAEAILSPIKPKQYASEAERNLHRSLAANMQLGENLKKLQETRPDQYAEAEKLRLINRARIIDELGKLPKNAETPSSKASAAPVLAAGPGAKTGGEAPYSAIQQLSDQINQTPKVGGRESLRLNEAAAEKWAKGKSSVEQAIGKMIAIKSSLASIARGVRTPTDLDAKVGSLDWALQRSSAQSKAAGEAIRRQVPNEDMRNAAAIWVDAGGDEGAIKDALSKLPEGTSPKVRRAVERAANLPPEMKQFAESLKQYFGIRQNDAISNEIFEQGLEDYFTHIWKNEDNMPGSVKNLINSGRVSTYFQFGRQRKIGTFLEGILEGKTPELDPSKVVPFYNYLLDRSIASRRFIKEASDLTAADGRPVLAPAGIAKPVEKGSTDETLFINPRAKAEETADYKAVDHPALRKWKWATTDENGKQTFYQSDLLVHPDHYERMARMMDRGRMTATKTGAALLRAGSEVKGLKLGLLSLFHQVHVGSHALWHWTDPIGAARNPINWEAPETQYAIEKGHLKLAPNPSELMQFEEGIISPGLVHKIPIIGPWSKAYGQWLFGEYIPRLKLATFQNALKRAETAYKGKLSPDEIAARTGDAVNNAFGELNQLFLGKNGRDPRFQRLLRGVFLAPDFGEARLNFVEKAFTKYGHEERLALATMFLTMYTTARFANWMSHGDPEWDLKRAFMVKSGDHWWTMRSVAGDAVHAVTDFGGFMRNRLSPLFGRTALELLTGRDSSGIKRTMPQQLTDLTKQGIPISMNGLTRSDQHIWESFVSSMGLSAIRDTPQQDVNNLVSQWKSKSTNPKLQAQVERAQKETMAPSDYGNLRLYLQWGDEKKASAELQKLLQVKSREDVRKALLPNKPFTGSWKYEDAFKNTLTPPQLQEYDRAKQQRQQIYERFQGLTSQKPGATIQPQNNGYQIGQVVPKAGKNWRITGFDTDGEPLVEEVK